MDFGFYIFCFWIFFGKHLRAENSLSPSIPYAWIERLTKGYIMSVDASLASELPAPRDDQDTLWSWTHPGRCLILPHFIFFPVSIATWQSEPCCLQQVRSESWVGRFQGRYWAYRRGAEAISYYSFVPLAIHSHCDQHGLSDSVASTVLQGLVSAIHERALDYLLLLIILLLALLRLPKHPHSDWDILDLHSSGRSEPPFASFD